MEIKNDLSSEYKIDPKELEFGFEDNQDEENSYEPGELNQSAVLKFTENLKKIKSPEKKEEYI